MVLDVMTIPFSNIPRRSLTMSPHIALILVLLASSAIAHSQRHDTTAIVGAGLSGISTAYHLVQNGHTNITIYEATSRPGGYINSVRYKNVTHEVGPYGVTALYWKFIAAAESLGFSFCPFESAIVFPTTPQTILNSTQFSASVSAPTLPDPAQYPMLLLEQITRYTKLWFSLFEIPFLNDRLETDRLFPSKPTNKDKLRRMSMPILNFLKRENLELLIPIFKLRTDTQGYGPIERTAALYYLTWNPPSVLLPTAQAYVPCDVGLEDIVQAMVDKLQRSGKVTFQYDAPVMRVKRGRRFAKVLTGDGVVDRYSRVVVTAKLENKEYRNLVSPLTLMEKRASKKKEDLEMFSLMLEGLRETSVANGVFLNLISNPLVNSRPNSAFWGNLVPELRSPDGPFHSDINTIVKIGYIFFYREQAMRKPVRLSGRARVRKVLRGMSNLDSTIWRPIQGYLFKNYFQRWRPKKVLEGLPWVLEESQGIGNVYYVNSAACGFESLGHIFECSERVAKQIESSD